MPLNPVFDGRGTVAVGTPVTKNSAQLSQEKAQIGTGMHRSRLFYYGTQVEVELGDHVSIRRWFRRPAVGFVSYVPGVSPRHEELEYEDVQQWAISLPNGTVYALLYHPETFQPPRKITFLERSTQAGLQPDAPLL